MDGLNPYPTPSPAQPCEAAKKRTFAMTKSIFHTFTSNYCMMRGSGVGLVYAFEFSWACGEREREEWVKMGHLLITKYDHFYVLCCSRFSWSPRAISLLAPRRVDSPHCCCNLLGILVDFDVVKITRGARCERRKESRGEW